MSIRRGGGVGLCLRGVEVAFEMCLFRLPGWTGGGGGGVDGLECGR